MAVSMAAVLAFPNSFVGLSEVRRYEYAHIHVSLNSAGGLDL